MDGTRHRPDSGADPPASRCRGSHQVKPATAGFLPHPAATSGPRRRWPRPRAQRLRSQPAATRAEPSAAQLTGIGSLISPTKPPASRLRNASMTHCPARSRTRRPLYRSSPVSGTARPVSNGPSTESTRHAPDGARPARVASLLRELPRQAREDQHRTPGHHLDLRYLQVPEARIGLGERGLHPPPHQIRRPGVPEDAPLTRRAAPRPGGHQHVPAIPAGVSEHPRVTPRLIPSRAEQLIPAWVALGHGRGGMALPGVQVGGGGHADALLDARPGVRAAGIEHEPGAVRAAGHRAGPGGHVVKRRARRRGQHISGRGPVDQILRAGVTDGDVEMPQLRVAQTAWRLEKEHVIGTPVIGEPEIPYPRVGQSQHGTPFRPEDPAAVAPPDTDIGLILPHRPSPTSRADPGHDAAAQRTVKPTSV